MFKNMLFLFTHAHVKVWQSCCTSFQLLGEGLRNVPVMVLALAVVNAVHFMDSGYCESLAQSHSLFTTCLLQYLT